MKLKKGDYIKVGGLTRGHISAVIEKFRDAGFEHEHCPSLNGVFDGYIVFLGVDSEEDIVALENHELFGTERRELTYDQIVGVNNVTHQDGFMNLSNDKKYSKYFIDVSRLNEIDIYMLLSLFQVTDHAVGHAIKKLLLAGDRTGGKSSMDDLVEARDTLNRKLEMLEQLR